MKNNIWLNKTMLLPNCVYGQLPSLPIIEFIKKLNLYKTL